MDCEKFDRVVLDMLYEELDELTTAAAKRHSEHCTRCRGIVSKLRATRQIGILPMVEAPAGLTQRILEAERRARAALPLRQRVGRAVSVLAGYAMRPQLGMAAVLLLMIGASLLFLRARPGGRESMHVIERGVPESEAENVAIVPEPEKAAGEANVEGQAHGALGELAPDRSRNADEPHLEPAPPSVSLAAGPSANAAGDAGSQYDQAMAAYHSGRYAEAQRLFAGVAAQGGDQAASAALLAAQAARSSTGCRTAAAMFDEVNARYSDSPIGHEAAWQAADCYRSLGQPESARHHYTELLAVAGYAERARGALAALERESGGAVATRRARSAPAKTDQAAPAQQSTPKAAKPAAPNAATQGF
jgi:TolA-binding protein